MNIQVGEIKTKSKIFLRKVIEFLKDKGEWVIPILFLVSIIYSVYLWYSYAFNSSWNAAQKSEYITTKQKDIVFNKDKFTAAISEIKERKVNYQKNLENIPDIFRFK